MCAIGQISELLAFSVFALRNYDKEEPSPIWIVREEPLIVGIQFPT